MMSGCRKIPPKPQLDVLNNTRIKGGEGQGGRVRDSNGNKSMTKKFRKSRDSGLLGGGKSTMIVHDPYSYTTGVNDDVAMQQEYSRNSLMDESKATVATPQSYCAKSMVRGSRVIDGSAMDSKPLHVPTANSERGQGQGQNKFRSVMELLSDQKQDRIYYDHIKDLDVIQQEYLLNYGKLAFSAFPKEYVDTSAPLFRTAFNISVLGDRALVPTEVIHMNQLISMMPFNIERSENNEMTTIPGDPYTPYSLILSGASIFKENQAIFQKEVTTETDTFFHYKSKVDCNQSKEKKSNVCRSLVQAVPDGAIVQACKSVRDLIFEDPKWLGLSIGANAVIDVDCYGGLGDNKDDNSWVENLFNNAYPQYKGRIDEFVVFITATCSTAANASEQFLMSKILDNAKLENSEAKPFYADQQNMKVSKENRPLQYNIEKIKARHYKTNVLSEKYLHFLGEPFVTDFTNPYLTTDIYKVNGYEITRHPRTEEEAKNLAEKGDLKFHNPQTTRLIDQHQKTRDGNEVPQYDNEKKVEITGRDNQSLPAMPIMRIAVMSSARMFNKDSISTPLIKKSTNETENKIHPTILELNEECRNSLDAETFLRLQQYTPKQSLLDDPLFLTNDRLPPGIFYGLLQCSLKVPVEIDLGNENFAWIQGYNTLETLRERNHVGKCVYYMYARARLKAFQSHALPGKVDDANHKFFTIGGKINNDYPYSHLLDMAGKIGVGTFSMAALRWANAS